MAAKKANELYITRMYDAPVRMVWDAWTDPKQVAQWWGPRGFSITTKSKDLRPGGTWVYTMHGPDGMNYPNITTYHEVEKYSKLVYDHGANENQPPMFRVTVHFSEVKGGKTKMEMTMAMADAETAAQTKKFIKSAGGDATWDRLAEFLGEGTEKKDIFVINRTFDAPIKTMFEMWTDPKHVANWLAPTGVTMEYIRAENRVGGTSFYSMTDGKDLTMYGKIHYLQISAPNRIAYTQQFCTKDEKISRHPHAPTWPETMHTTVTFSEEGPDQTRVTVRWEVYGEATADEKQMFHDAKPGMTVGWTGSFDKLEDCLPHQK